MKKYFSFLFIILLSLPVLSQDNQPDPKRKKKAEARVSFVEYKYLSGEYEEAIASAKRFSNNLERNQELWTKELVQIKLFQALSDYASLNFEKAEQSFTKAAEYAEKSLSDSTRITAYTLLADYLQETEELVRAVQYLNKAQALLKAEHGMKLKADLDLVKIKTLLKQGYLNDAWKLLEDQKGYRVEMASAFTVGEENREVLSEKNDYIKRKELFALHSNLKALCLAEKGSFKEAEDVLKNNLFWIQKNLNNNHEAYRNALELQAKIQHSKNDFDHSATLFTDAYTCTTYPEYEYHKINDLSQLIISCIESGQIVKYKNYLRRLEMYAFRSVVSNDLYQLAFEYTESYKSFLEGDYTSASKRLNKVTETFAFLPPSHSWTYKLIELKAAIARESGDIKTYKESLLKLSDTQKKYSGEQSPVYHKTEMLRALYEINYGKDFSSAEEIMKKSYSAILKKEIERESRENIGYLTAYAELFGKTDRYDSARVKAMEAAEIAALLYNEKSPEYGVELAEYAEFQILSGKYKEGFENLEKLSGLMAYYKEGDIQLLQKTHMIAARLYALKGEFDKSQVLLNKAYKLVLVGYEKQVLAEAAAYEQLGSLYLLTGNYYRAEKSLLNSLEIKEKTLETGSPLVIPTLLELARLNLLNGNFGAADQYLKRATEQTSEVFGNQSMMYSECQLVYGDYYFAIGDYKKAEEAALNADEICIQKSGKNNLKRAEVLTKIALVRSRIPSWKKTEIDKLYVEAGNIIKNALGTENPLYALLIQKQAELYTLSGKADQADQLLDKAEKFWNSKLGTENRYSAEIELLRGDIAYLKNNYEKAEKNYSKSRNLYAGIFSNEHPLYIQASGKLARVYFMQKNIEKSLTEMEEIIPKYLDYIVNYFPSLSFREKSKFWNSIKEEFEFYNYITLCVYNKENPKLSANVYDNIIATKALLLSSNLKIRERILSSQDTILIDLYNNWVSQKEYLTNVLSFTKQQLADQNISLKDIETDIYTLEKEISKRSELFSGEEKKQRITWKEIKNELGENEYAVEMVSFRYFNKTFTDSTIYAALILNNKTIDNPEVVIFPNGETLEKRNLKLYRNSVIFKTKDQTSYNAYWKPLKAKIPDEATVYLSSDGVYNQINLEMMASSEGEYVIDHNQIVSVTNTKDLLNKKKSSEPKAKNKESKKQQQSEELYVLCGNPEFYSGKVDVTEESVKALPGAEHEVNGIDNLLSNTGKTSLKFTRDYVREDTIKEIKDPTVFHIATHGYFKEEKDSGDEGLASNPLLNSGLVLFAGGDIINHPENNYVNSKDGILTAYEAMNLSFDHTELVVLSACETGRGEVQVGEGVYGLQRSFLIAGADAVIMSLFKVNDEVTQKLMLTFYDKWMKTGDKRSAFIEAKREIKKQYPDPIYWGAFIMIEGKPRVNKSSQP